MTDKPNSPVAGSFIAGLGYRNGVLDKRKLTPVAVVVHTTGGGILARFDREGAKKGDASPLETAVRVYSKIMTSSGHYVIGQRGECVQMVPEMTVAQHVGSAKSRAYYLPREKWLSPELAWWAKRWPGMNSPLDLAGGNLWRNGSCNQSTIGIEVVPPLTGAREPWSVECWDTLARLALDICARHSIQADAEHVVTHSDAHPISRTAQGSAWDPSINQWGWELMRRALSGSSR